MKKEILFIILNDFADWESAYVSAALNSINDTECPHQYAVKTLSLTKNPVMSIGGFKILPDYDINNIPTDYAGIILIGGTRWFLPEAEAILPLVKDAIDNNKLVAGICNASVFLGMHGFLNSVKHTSNGLDYLKGYAGTNYSGESYYINSPAVSNKNIITSNGLSSLEFCKEILYALKANTPENIEKNYRMNKTGIWEM